MRAQRGIAIEVPVVLLSSDDFKTAKTGVAYNASGLAVYIRKAGGTAAAKSLASDDWEEVGNGIYTVALNTTDTNTLGCLIYWVTYSGSLSYQGVISVEPIGTADTLYPM